MVQWFKTPLNTVNGPMVLAAAPYRESIETKSVKITIRFDRYLSIPRLAKKCSLLASFGIEHRN